MISQKRPAGGGLKPLDFRCPPFFSPLSPPTSKKHPPLPKSCQLKGLFTHQTPRNCSKSLGGFFSPLLRGRSFIGTSADPRSRFGKFGVPTVGCLGSPPKFQFGELRSPAVRKKVNPAWKPVEVGRIYHSLQGFIHPNGGWPWDFWTINSMSHGFFSWWVPRKTLSQLKERGFFKTSDDACGPYLLRRGWTILRCSDAVDRINLL